MLVRLHDLGGGGAGGVLVTLNCNEPINGSGSITLTLRVSGALVTPARDEHGGRLRGHSTGVPPPPEVLHHPNAPLSPLGLSCRLTRSSAPSL